MNKNSFDISIVIPNLHSPMIGQTIESLSLQETNYSYQIIVVGQDKYNLVNTADDRVIFIETENPTIQAVARNIGVENSIGEYILFIDADCLAPSHWVKAHMDVHTKSQYPIVVGGGVAFPMDKYFALADNVSTFHEYMEHIPPGKKMQLPSLNMSWNISISSK